MGNLINANLPNLNIGVPDIAGAMARGEKTRQLREQGERQREEDERRRKLEQLQQEILQESQQAGFEFGTSTAAQQLAAFSPQDAMNSQLAFSRLSTERKQSFFNDAKRGLDLIKRDDFKGVVSLIDERRKKLAKFPGADSSDTEMLASYARQGEWNAVEALLEATVQGGIDAGFLKDTQAEREERDLSKREREARIKALDQGQIESASSREFNSLIKDLSKEDQTKAKMIKLGLTPRAVGSAIQTITEQGLENQIGDASAAIKQREKYAETTGSDRARRIDKGFERIVKIDTGISNINRAIRTIQSGAGVGAVNKLLPSIRAASVELDQIQNELALDVIGGVTLGAISEAELDLAKTVALPKGLSKDQLIRHLEDRRAAQEKLRAYFNRQIQHLDQGGTIASFMRQMEREQQQGTQPQPEVQAPLQQGPQVFRFDEQGNLIP